MNAKMKLAVGCVWAVLALGCTKQERSGGGGVKPPKADALEVKAALAAVTLGDDCGIGAEMKEDKSASASESMAKRAPSADDSIAAGDCAGPGPCGGGGGGISCTQSSLQLALTAGDKGAKESVKIVRLELFEVGSNKSLGEVTPRAPQVWVEAAGTYQTWDGVIAPSQQLKVMFQLSAPDWGPVGGRFEAQGKTFRLKATISVGGAESTVEKEVQSAEVMVEPEVMT